MLIRQEEYMKTPSFRDDISGRYASIRSRAGLTKKAFAESLGIHPVVSEI